MKYLIRPLTKRMITKLIECRQMELEAKTGHLCPPEHFNSSLPGLYVRGLINVKKYSVNGKELMGVYLTQNGINCLAHIEILQKRPA
jgi:hypothetical protein